MMRCKWQGFCATNHSWAFVAQNISRELIRRNNNVEMYSTNGKQFFPEDLLPYLYGYAENNKWIGKTPNGAYDVQFTYTAPPNFKNYTSSGIKNRLAIWCWEFSGKNTLPQGFAKYHQYVDWILPPSEYAKRMFIDSGVPEKKLRIVPHGIDLEKIIEAKPLNINSDKVKLVVNIGQAHLRKGITETLDAFGKAFNKNSNVIFVIKVSDKIPNQAFEISFKDELRLFKSKYPNHAEIKIIKEFVPNIYSLYKGCDIYFHLTKAEGFGMPLLEAQASGLLVMAPDHGGQKDFLNKTNSILIDGKETPANPRALYWEQHNRGMWFSPNIDDAVDKLKNVVNNIEKYKSELKIDQNDLNEKYSWRSVVDRIEGLIK